MRVVVTREAGLNDEVRRWLPDGVEVLDLPLTTTVYADEEEVRASLAALAEYGSFQSLVVTSARGARFAALSLESLAPGAKLLCVGVATASALGAVGAPVDVVGAEGAARLAPSIGPGPVLLLGATTAREELPTILRERGEVVRSIGCYTTVPLALSDDDRARLHAADVVVIGAPSAWRVARDDVNVATLVVVPGATTAQEVRRDHDRVLVAWGPSLREHLGAL